MAASSLPEGGSGGQKFIARNRAPRVQIEYDVEIDGHDRRVEIPFVMGVMADLAGKSNKPQPDLEQRKFLEIDADNFDDRMRSLQPRVAFHVPNELTGDGMMAVDLTFESIEDFSPAQVARRVAALNTLLDARTQLANLLAYMDGKSGAEALISQALKHPPLLQLLAVESRDEDGDQSSTRIGGGEPEE